MEYLKKARRAKPEIAMKALEYINLGYQRLLTFECPGGGFDWMGNPPANQILSAWGLLEFVDMAKVYEIDKRIIERTKKWLLSKQNKDGSWLEKRTSWTWSGVKGKLVQTAYISWALLEAGYKGKQIDKAIKFIKESLDDANDNPYVLGLIANALALYNPKDEDLDIVLSNLDDIKTEDTETGVCYWKMLTETLYYAKGRAAEVEATSLITLAMIKANKFHSTVNKALGFLVKSKDARGTWGSTQATILALKTLVCAMSGQRPKGDIKIKVKLNGKEETIIVKQDQWDVMQVIDFKQHTKQGENILKIEMQGKGNLMYQVVGRYFLPWELVEEKEEKEAISFKIEYDRTKLTLKDLLGVKVWMKYNEQKPTYMVIIDLGIPAGFQVIPDAFDKLVSEKVIEKYTLTGRQIILYFGSIKPGQEVEFSYQMKAKYPIKVKTPVSQVYEYYSPQNRTKTRPVELTVTE
jgi:uncharacterized protein YfaS (alpha-2-macroglobulin family)